jgi:hypothetical protein
MRTVFTVYFEGPFWVGILESEDEGILVVARHVFGTEPGNAELLGFMLNGFHLMRRQGSPSLRQGPAGDRPRNPKRLLRDARRDAAKPPATKAQAALSASREARKSESKALRRAAREDEEARRFLLHAGKRREKHRGH